MIPQTILRLIRRSSAPTINALYGAIVAQARKPVFYAGFAVPDTVEGRFDMVVLHLVLVLRRLRRDAGLAKLAQGLFDSFCRDMDHNLREMGVSDLSVPKEMKRLGEAFYGRQRAYEEALSGNDAVPLAAALGRNVFSGDHPRAAALLADYALRAAARLDATDAAALVRGQLAFFDPDAILAGAEPLQEDR
jgi:cytochrome b pre-mRNA-processing protein 3